MMDRTFAIIKPDAVKNGHTGNIYDRIQKFNFKVIGAKLLRMSQEQAEGFYGIHKERPFFNDLIKFMTSGPCMVLALEKENAVEDFRTLIGATNPADAAEGTIRKMFADSISENAVHGSDSDDNAAIEGAFHFSGRDTF